MRMVNIYVRLPAQQKNPFSVRSQFVTSRGKEFFAGQEGGRRYLPYAFTEQGIYMLATVLRGELAEQQSIFIMRTFREMRRKRLIFDRICF